MIPMTNIQQPTDTPAEILLNEAALDALQPFFEILKRRAYEDGLAAAQAGV